MIVNSEGLKNQGVSGSSPEWRIWFGLASTPPLSEKVGSVNMDFALKLPPTLVGPSNGIVICGLVENAI